MVISLTEIKNNIETAVSVHLTTNQKAVRDLMLRTIQTELRRHGITRLCCSGFKVYLLKDEKGNYEKLALGFDTLNISLDDCCPRCGENFKKAMLLYTFHADTDREEHILGCKCGHIYKIYWGC